VEELKIVPSSFWDTLFDSYPLLLSIKANIAQEQLLSEGPYSPSKTTSFLNDSSDDIFNTNLDISLQKGTQKHLKVSHSRIVLQRQMQK
jgi:hypothetical protein